MKKLWNSFKVAFSMFSKIPMPKADWTKENMSYMLCFFPWVGAVIGLLTFLITRVGLRFEFSIGFMSAVMILIPILVTGGIHVDGLLDTADSLSSWREKSRRLEILKDPHAGAFAIIIGCSGFALFYGVCTQIYPYTKAVKIFCIGYAVSRCFSGLGVLTLPKANAEGTVAKFAQNSSDRIVRIVLILYLILLYCAMAVVNPVFGTAGFAAALVAYIYYRHIAMKYFGGTTGDINGFFVCICECLIGVVLAVMCAVIY